MVKLTNPNCAHISSLWLIVTIRLLCLLVNALTMTRCRVSLREFNSHRWNAENIFFVWLSQAKTAWLSHFLAFHAVFFLSFFGEIRAKSPYFYLHASHMSVSRKHSASAVLLVFVELVNALSLVHRVQVRIYLERGRHVGVPHLRASLHHIYTGQITYYEHRPRPKSRWSWFTISTNCPWSATQRIRAWLLRVYPEAIARMKKTAFCRALSRGKAWFFHRGDLKSLHWQAGREGEAVTFEELYAKVKRSTADDLTNERIYNLIIDETMGNPTGHLLCEFELYARAKELKEDEWSIIRTDKSKNHLISTKSTTIL